jgi:hypothetical protein
MDKPQIVIHSSKSISYTAYDVKWVPSTPKFVVLGQNANGTGVIQQMELSAGTIEKINEVISLHI